MTLAAHRATGIAINKEKRQKEDWYVTPRHVTEALIEREYFTGTIWEPACGDGAMSKVLIGYGYNVISSDLFDRGYGETGVDFLKSEYDFIGKRIGIRAHNIITNPPYSRGILNKFIYKAVSETPRKVCMVMRIQALETLPRREIFKEFPPARVWVFSDRVMMLNGGQETKDKSQMCYAWFVWEAGFKGKTQLDWI